MQRLIWSVLIVVALVAAVVTGHSDQADGELVWVSPMWITWQ